MPCKKCKEGKYKWGKTGECEYATKEACESANHKYKEMKQYPTPLGKKTYEEYAKELKEFNLSKVEKVYLGAMDDLKKAVNKLKKYNLEKQLSELKSQYKTINNALTKIKSQSKTFVQDYGKFEVQTDKQWKDYQAASKISNQIVKDLRELGIKGEDFTREYDNILADAETIGQESFKATQKDFKNYNDIVDLIE